MSSGCNQRRASSGHLTERSPSASARTRSIGSFSAWPGSRPSLASASRICASNSSRFSSRIGNRNRTSTPGANSTARSPASRTHHPDRASPSVSRPRPSSTTRSHSRVRATSSWRALVNQASPGRARSARSKSSCCMLTFCPTLDALPSRHRTPGTSQAVREVHPSRDARNGRFVRR